MNDFDIYLPYSFTCTSKTSVLLPIIIFPTGLSPSSRPFYLSSSLLDFGTFTFFKEILFFLKRALRS